MDPSADDSLLKEETILNLNKQALENLHNPSTALSNLQQAERILLENASQNLKNRLKLMALTFNNFACYYKRMNQPNVALLYLNQASKLEYQTLSSPIDLASTQLNLCAINSQLGRHAAALENAKQAIKFFSQVNENELSSNEISKIVAAYFNAGTEFEYTYNLEEAFEHMQKGFELGKKYLHLNHPLVKNICKSLNNLKERKERLKLLADERKSERKMQKIISQSISPPPLNRNTGGLSKKSTSKRHFASFGQTMVSPKYNPLKLPITMTMRHDRLIKRDIDVGLKVYLMDNDSKHRTPHNVRSIE
ncbi:unnamed protein product [Blepharisma stoltei]|uniref:Uncharacterized protein n=1 Tax=Blepharisma stoltei TaxID=1481888 RepID=A0AAU9JK68_9CILI|nr:unnamed protein product [Blepharisma stoltei]